MPGCTSSNNYHNRKDFQNEQFLGQAALFQTKHLPGPGLCRRTPLPCPPPISAPQTYQVRVVSEVQGWIVFGVGSTSGTTLSCTAQSGSAKINANTDEEFWTVQPGMMCAFNQHSTSSGMISITEMA